jgi:lipooligosaccharide transport system ATP-binding protein
MHFGKILNVDTPKNLIYKYIGKEVWEIGVNSDEREKTIKELERRGLDFENVVGGIHVFHVETEEQVGGLSLPIGKLRRRPATLEDVFFRLTGRSLIE